MWSLNTQPDSYKILLIYNVREVRKVRDVPPIAYVPYIACHVTSVTIPRHIALPVPSWTVPVLTN
jgi:hypothetical protein